MTQFTCKGVKQINNWKILKADRRDGRDPQNREKKCSRRKVHMYEFIQDSVLFKVQFRPVSLEMSIYGNEICYTLHLCIVYNKVESSQRNPENIK